MDWDDEVPSDTLEMWLRWRNELVYLSDKFIPRCYFSRLNAIGLASFRENMLLWGSASHTKAMSSSIFQLQPFIDLKGLLRIGGRQRISRSISYEARHPLILHRKYPITQLIVHSTYMITTCSPNPTLCFTCYQIPCSQRTHEYLFSSLSMYHLLPSCSQA